jgi:hypothetical protein
MSRELARLVRRAATAPAWPGPDRLYSRRPPLLRQRLGERSLTRLAEWANRESLLIAIVGIVVGAVLIRLPVELQQDSWLTLVAGREVAQHGLPQVDTLTAWTHGVKWTDQQWLAQLSFYWLSRVGGIKLALLVHALLVATAFGLAVVCARLRGGGARASSLIAAVALFPLVINWQMRAQSFAFPLYVLLFWLLSSDSRSPSRRVFLVAPLLVLWANLHGSVVLAAGLVALYGLMLALKRQDFRGGTRRRTGLLLFGLAIVAPFASPYGLALIGYYKSTLFNPGFGALVVEWGAATPSIMTAPFYLLAFGSFWLFGRHGRRLTRFEQLSLLITLIAGLHAMRNMSWFALTALVLLPVMLTEALPDGYQPFSRIRVVVPALVCAVAAVLAAVVVAKPASWVERDFPATALSRIETVASRDPGSRVYADEHYADWLLWKDPSLRGRVAFDARLELLSNRQLLDLYFWHSRIGSNWQAAAGRAKLLVLDVTSEPLVEKDLLAGRKARRLFRNGDLSVLELALGDSSKARAGAKSTE